MSAAICYAAPAAAARVHATAMSSRFQLQRRQLHAGSSLLTPQQPPPPPLPRRAPNVVPRPPSSSSPSSASSSSSPFTRPGPGHLPNDGIGGLSILATSFHMPPGEKRMPWWKRLLAIALGTTAALWLAGAWWIGSEIHSALDEADMAAEEEDTAVAHFDASA